MTQWFGRPQVMPEPEVVENTFFDLLLERNIYAKFTGGIRDSDGHPGAILSTKNHFRQFFYVVKIINGLVKIEVSLLVTQTIVHDMMLKAFIEIICCPFLKK